MLFLIYAVAASVRNKAFPLGGPRNVIAVDSSTNFCMFLPANVNETIAESEGYPFASEEESKKWAVSHCTQANNNAPGHALFYDGFITGAHYGKTDTMVFVTGTIDATKAGIPLDGGGYYDLDNNVNSPPGGICAGYDSFYNFVSPIDGIFCLKCCKGIDACEIFNGEKGCSVMVPGNYNKGFDGPAPPKTGRVLGSLTTVGKSDTNITQSTPKKNVGIKQAAHIAFLSYILLLL
jgi:hypothetical protein